MSKEEQKDVEINQTSEEGEGRPTDYDDGTIPPQYKKLVKEPEDSKSPI